MRSGRVPRQIVADFLPPRKFNQLFRFTGVEVAGYPFGLLAFNAELIQLVASALKNKQPMPKLLEIGERFPVDRKCVWREQPFFLGKEALFGKGARMVVSRSACPCTCMMKRTSNAQRRTSNAEWKRLDWIFGAGR